MLGIKSSIHQCQFCVKVHLFRVQDAFDLILPVHPDHQHHLLHLRLLGIKVALVGVDELFQLL